MKKLSPMSPRDSLLEGSKRKRLRSLINRSCEIPSYEQVDGNNQQCNNFRNNLKMIPFRKMIF